MTARRPDHFERTAYSLRKTIERLRGAEREKIAELRGRTETTTVRRALEQRRRLLALCAEIDIAIERNTRAHRAPKDERRR